MLDIREILRRLGQGETERRIAHELKVSRKTVRRCWDWAAQPELLGSALPPTAVLAARLAVSLPAVSPPLTVSKAEQFVAQIRALRRQGVECRAIHQRLREEHAFTGSYSSIWRLVRRLEPQVPEAAVWIEVGPGAEAQVDFGYAGRMLDPRSEEVRNCWAFVTIRTRQVGGDRLFPVCRPPFRIEPK